MSTVLICIILRIRKIFTSAVRVISLPDSKSKAGKDSTATWSRSFGSHKDCYINFEQVRQCSLTSLHNKRQYDLFHMSSI